jgi:hypothetical protein
MGSIYEIICWTTGLRYIGQTKNSLKQRLIEHKSRNSGTSKLILEHGNYEIYEIEKVDNKELLTEREQYHINHTDCVNYITGMWKLNSKEYHKTYMREYRK